jgi:D-amino-acid oxidase
VQGATTAWLLSQVGYPVELHSAQPFDQTTSNVAAAFFYPFAVGDYPRRWAAISLDTFRSLSLLPDAGIIFRKTRTWIETGRSLDQEQSAFWWNELHGVNLRLQTQRLHFDFGDRFGKVDFCGCLEFETAVVDMSRYLRFLFQGLQQRNVPVKIGVRYPSLAAATEGEADVLVNCCGFASRSLTGLTDIRRVWGQSVRVIADQIDTLTFVNRDTFADSPLYIVPRIADVILGGTFDPRPDAGSSLEMPAASPETTAEIIAKCSVMEPSLKKSRVLESRVGIRPCREKIRLEQEIVHEKTVIHNYGHGGSGVTLSWGCAHDVLALIEQHA